MILFLGGQLKSWWLWATVAGVQQMLVSLTLKYMAHFYNLNEVFIIVTMAAKFLKGKGKQSSSSSR